MSIEHVANDGIIILPVIKSRQYLADGLKSKTVVLDVTENPALLEQARMEVAVSYSRLAGVPRDAVDVYRELCLDGYENHGGERSRTIATVTPDPITGVKRVSGTVRLVIGQKGVEEYGLFPLDALSLVDVPNWPHNLDTRSDVHIGELGRFTISEDYRKRALRGVSHHVTSLLFKEASRIASLRGVQYLYAIMPSAVSKLCKQAGIESSEIIESRLLWGNELAEKIFNTYPGYWKKQDPRLYTFTNFDKLEESN